MKTFSAYDFLSEFVFTAIRSRGPGGQNVNKVSSAALLSWAFAVSDRLSAEHKAVIQQKLAAYINKEGALYLRSDEYRDLQRNKDRCIEKLEMALERAFHVDKARRPSKPTRSSKMKKRKTKEIRGAVKKDRQKKWSSD